MENKLSGWQYGQTINVPIEFYIKWGFEKFAEQDFILGNDVQRDWLMKKTL
jgi:hypothetical protein